MAAVTPNEQTPKAPRVALLIARGALANMVANAFARRFQDLLILSEPPENKGHVFRRRARIGGYATACSQLAATALQKVLALKSRSRFHNIVKQYGLDPHLHDQPNRVLIETVNGDDCRMHLAQFSPDVVAVYGTRLIRRETLEAVSAPFVNYHAGLTPTYRGQHPAYWALASGDPDGVGVTVHLVDQGVDTGAVIAQAPVPLSPRDDTIATYQVRQMATALPLFLDAVQGVAAGTVSTHVPEGVSRNWLPPTLGVYLANGLRRGVW